MSSRAQSPPQQVPLAPSLLQSPFGISAADTQDALKAEHYKELVNKVAWTLGSAYGLSYSSINNPTRKYAHLIVAAIIRDHGFPTKLAK